METKEKIVETVLLAIGVIWYGITVLPLVIFRRYGDRYSKIKTYLAVLAGIIQGMLISLVINKYIPSLLVIYIVMWIIAFFGVIFI